MSRTSFYPAFLVSKNTTASHLQTRTKNGQHTERRSLLMSYLLTLCLNGACGLRKANLFEGCLVLSLDNERTNAGPTVSGHVHKNSYMMQDGCCRCHPHPHTVCMIQALGKHEHPVLLFSVTVLTAPLVCFTFC